MNLNNRFYLYFLTIFQIHKHSTHYPFLYSDYIHKVVIVN